MRTTETTVELRACLALVSALLRQIIALLPAEFETESDLSVPAFRPRGDVGALYGGYLKLFRELSPLIPNRSTVICVISGFDKLNHNSTDQYLRHLLGVLEGSGFKVLITTN